MKENEILSEIHRIREEFARECGYDVNEIFRRMRERTEKLKATGVKVVSPGSRNSKETSYALREESPKKSE